jgi:hypothetical protein
MSESYELQTRFLDAIKQMLPASTSLVSEISDLLEVSNDSAYRRIRGETALSLDEIAKICHHFNFSLDSLFSIDVGTVTFNYLMLKGVEHYREYLTSIVRDLTMISESDDAEIIYAATDIPIFHHFRYPKLAAFKMFYWLRAVVNEPELASKKFSFDLIPEDMIELGRKVYDLYSEIPSYELWTNATITSNIKQIEFFWESGVFESSNDALDVCNELREEISFIQRQAELKSKVVFSDKVKSGYENNYLLHVSDIEIGNNCILIRMNKMKGVYLSHQTFNKLFTTNTKFTEETHLWLSGIIQKSTLISGVAEKIRYQFFRDILRQIDKLVSIINGD